MSKEVPIRTNDLEVEVEHMFGWHKAASREEAHQITKDNPGNFYTSKKLPSTLHTGFEPIDMREHPRKNFEAKLIINSLNTGDCHVGWTRNISMGGIRVRTETRPLPFIKAEKVAFVSDIGGFTLIGNGRVIWTSYTAREAGIKFTHLAEETRGPLEEFLGSLP